MLWLNQSSSWQTSNCLQAKKTKSRRKKAMETRQMITIETTKVVVVEAVANAETVTVVVAATLDPV
jgi:hypothetical protein